MQNRHIELVEKWLADNDSVSKEELEANRNAAFTVAATAAAADNAAIAAAAKAFAAAHAFADFAQANADAADAAYWVAKYHELVEEKRP